MKAKTRFKIHWKVFKNFIQFPINLQNFHPDVKQQKRGKSTTDNNKREKEREKGKYSHTLLFIHRILYVIKMHWCLTVEVGMSFTWGIYFNLFLFLFRIWNFLYCCSVMSQSILHHHLLLSWATRKSDFFLDFFHIVGIRASSMRRIGILKAIKSENVEPDSEIIHLF